MEYLFIDGSYDGQYIAIGQSATCVDLWNDGGLPPRWYTINEAPKDVIKEFTDRYIRIYLGSYFNKAYHVYLYDNSPIELEDLFNHVLLNYKKE